MTDQWNSLNEGEERIFGFLQVDIAKSSELRGSRANKQTTKANLRRVVTGILNSYGARKLSWPGDGGAFILLIVTPSEDYNNIVAAALHVLQTMPFFNAMKGLHSFLKEDLSVRISCHEGRANFSKNPEQMHSDTLNYFLKYEREIGHQNAVTITEDVYDQLTSDSIRNLFEPVKQHEYVLAGKRYSKDLYVSRRGYPITKSLVVKERKTWFQYEEDGSLKMTTRRVVENWTKQPVRILRLERVAEFLPFAPEDLEIKEPCTAVYYPPPGRGEPREMRLEKHAEHNYLFNLTALAKGQPNVLVFEWQYIIKEGAIEGGGGRLQYSYDLTFKGGLEKAKKGTEAGVATLELPEEDVSVFLRVVPSNYRILLAGHHKVDQLSTQHPDDLRAPVLEQEHRALRWEIGDVPPYTQCLFQFQLVELT